jgi:hypothetical protein
LTKLAELRRHAFRDFTCRVVRRTDPRWEVLTLEKEVLTLGWWGISRSDVIGVILAPWL